MSKITASSANLKPFQLRNGKILYDSRNTFQLRNSKIIMNVEIPLFKVENVSINGELFSFLSSTKWKTTIRYEGKRVKRLKENVIENYRVKKKEVIQLRAFILNKHQAFVKDFENMYDGEKETSALRQSVSTQETSGLPQTVAVRRPKRHQCLLSDCINSRNQSKTCFLVIFRVHTFMRTHSCAHFNSIIESGKNKRS